MGAEQAFVATVSNDASASGVSWSLSGGGCAGAGCGAISPATSGSGFAVTYKAPSIVPNPPTVIVTATPLADNSKSASSLVTITPTNGRPVSFAAPRYYSVGSQPYAVVAGDFNQDGNLDVVVTNIGDANISVLLGNGDGTFRPAVNYRVGAYPRAVAISDFDNDGRPDLATTNTGSNTVSVLLGNGDGTFQQALGYNVGQSPDALVVADFNKDGRADLAVALLGDPTFCNSGIISILLGNGDGTFAPGVNYDAGPCPLSLAVADLNRDTRPDLITQSTVLFGDGNGSFQPPVSLNYGSGHAPGPVVVGDLNHDGRQDLVGSVTVAPFVRSLRVLIGEGDGTFESAMAYSGGAWPVVLAMADFDGDGNLDVAATSVLISGVNIMLGDGAGALQPPVSLTLGTLPKPAGIAAGDFNGDGYPDLAITLNANNTVAFLLNTP